MECKEAQGLITKYISGNINDKELEQVLEHVGGCKECYEELEINYTIFTALMQLEDTPQDFDEYDMNSMFLKELNTSKKYILRKRTYRHIRNIIYMVLGAAAILAAIIQLWLWL
ncbi:zf-HC2 domain-containing protein [Konateibacter massiliensis]|uniref:zf-HC2 domain-containing protein n=1 Tax=Konateibacter massiliensis TaxID=2002841 RepID=UPI000C14AF4F|nr:zf-HC2 domain-containing protein [Konateibacter massiliensis]